MSTARAERLVNLVLALLSTRQYLTADRIRKTVPGYADAASDEAFARMFERDKTELRDLGIPLETGRNSYFDVIDGYRIARRDYELGEIDLTPDEAAAVGLAAQLWDSPELANQAQSAVVKLRAAGVDVDQSARAVVESRVRTEPAFTPMIAAVQSRQAVQFDYRRSNSPDRQTRVLEPWGVVSWRSRWYVVGHDRDRDAARCFRLSRISGEVRLVGAAGEVEPPPSDVSLLEFVAGFNDVEPGSATTATLWIADDRAAGLRRHARVVDRMEIDGISGDVVDIDVWFMDNAATWIVRHSPDVVVLSPDTLAKSVRDKLESIVEAAS